MCRILDFFEPICKVEKQVQMKMQRKVPKEEEFLVNLKVNFLVCLDFSSPFFPIKKMNLKKQKIQFPQIHFYLLE